MKKTIAIALLSLAVGCKKKGSDSASAPGADDLPDAVSAWMPKGAQAAWEGAWKGRMTLEMGGTHSMAGDPAAFEIRGDKATVFDGKTDHALGFALESPCEAKFAQELTEGNMKGGTSYHTIQYVIRDGKAVLGDGGVGYRKGKTAMFCASSGAFGSLHTLDDKGECLVWDRHFHDKWDSKKDDCKWTTADGKDVLEVGSGDWKTKLVADGDFLYTDQFKDESKLYEKVADFAAAKTAATAAVKAADPGEKAKAAGGKAGDMTTILGLQATYAADKSMKGKPLEITALYLNSSSWTSDGKTSYAVELVDAKDKTDFTLHCDVKEEPKGFMQYDKVVAKGTVDEAFNQPSLKDCTVAKAP
jgi:hypothetical protein